MVSERTGNILQRQTHKHLPMRLLSQERVNPVEPHLNQIWLSQAMNAARQPAVEADSAVGSKNGDRF